MENKSFDLKQYAQTARAAVAEGIVMLRNEGHMLLLGEGEKITLFGRGQFHYYKSGTGSGGMVNTSHVTGIREALEDSSFVLNKELETVYRDWLEENPFDAGIGWAGEPWFQKEMPLTEDEEEMLRLVCGAFARTAVLLNVCSLCGFAKT